ncbi:MAG: PAS domain S-box protein [Bacteroidota bacterium]
MRESEKNFRTIFSSVGEGIFLSDIKTGWFIDVNPAGCEMFGYTRDEIVGADIGLLSSGEEPYTLDGARALGKKIVEEGLQRFEWHVKARDGRLFWVEISSRFATFGDRSVAFSTVRDITERKRAEAVILQMARFDPLTGLANRRVFVEELEHALARCRRGKNDLAASISTSTTSRTSTTPSVTQSATSSSKRSAGGCRPTYAKSIR